MCGIIGYISKHKGMDVANGLRSFMYQGLYVDALRGKDSTGVFSVDKMNQARVESYKRAVEANDFIQMLPARRIIDNTFMSSVMVGHNRSSTVGKTTSVNAHPFEHGHIIGVHNGTLLSRNGLRDKDKFEVDSENIFYTFSLHNPSDIIPQLHGAFALIWYDMKDGLVHIIRNNDRTLYFCNAKDNDTILIASERGMLTWIANRSGFGPENVSIFETGVEYIFDPAKPREFTTRKHELYVPPPVVSNFYRVNDNNHTKFLPGKKDYKSLETLGLFRENLYSFYISDFKIYKKTDRGAMIGWMTEYPFSKTVVHGVKQKDFLKKYKDTYVDGSPVSIQSNNGQSLVVFEIDIESVVDNRGYFGPNGKPLTEAEWLNLVKDGCSMCSADLLPSNSQIVSWDEQGNPFCKLCYVDTNKSGAYFQ